MICKVIPFVKYSACGNDFILIDNRNSQLDSLPISQWCHRHHGIGADGIVLLEKSLQTDFAMRIFNSDGSEAAMCGNGVRSLAHFIHTITGQTAFCIETKSQIIQAKIEEGIVSIAQPLPKEIKFYLICDGMTIHYLNTGVPHAILFVEEIECDSLMPQARTLRFHPDFSPEGTNVTFVQLFSDQTIAVRTYERGVEGETLACGTGAVAAAIAAHHLHHLDPSIIVNTRTGTQLKITISNDTVTTVGSAAPVFSGHVNYLF